ncbi:plasmalemma vesicle associated protein b [Mustelus asterias]
MDHNSYPMKKLGYDSRDYERAKSNSCGTYVKYFLLCTSIIQLLIIMGLVLFMTYGNNQSRQQTHLESTQNQSVEFIGEINKLRAIRYSQGNELMNCGYKSGNLTAQLIKINKVLNTCISQKNALNSTRFHGIINPYSSGPNVKSQWEFMKSCESLQANYSIVQRKLAIANGEKELQEARHILVEMKLNSQLAELRGNCSSMGKAFQKMMAEIKTNYEVRFRPLAEQIGRHYDQSLSQKLEKIRANCIPLSSNFQSELQEKIDRFDAIVKGVWQNNNDQSSKISTLEKMNEKCKRDAEAEKYQFKTKESEMQDEKAKYLAEKVQLLVERNTLRGQLEKLKPEFINAPSSCHREITAMANAQAEYWVLKNEKLLLEGRRAELEQELEGLRKQLREPTASCYNLMEEGKRLGCRMSG